MEELKELLKMYVTAIKILFTGVVGAAALIGLILLALSLKQCATTKQTTKPPISHAYEN